MGEIGAGVVLVSIYKQVVLSEGPVDQGGNTGDHTS